MRQVIESLLQEDDLEELFFRLISEHDRKEAEQLAASRAG